MSGHFFHLLEHSIEVVLFVRVGQVEIPLKLFIAEFVSLLVLSVLLRVLLNCVVGKVHLDVLDISSLKCLTACSDVPVFVPVSLDSVDRCDHHIMPEVELPSVVKERFGNIELGDNGLVPCLLAMDFKELRQRVDDYDILPSIRILAWLDNPQVVDLLSLLL